MATIFQRKDAEANPEPGFWQAILDDFASEAVNILHRDCVLRKATDGQSIKLLLSDTALYLYEDRPDRGLTLLKRVYLQWKQFEPFVVKGGSTSHQGFRLGQGDCFEEFFTQNTAKLDIWIVVLSRLCIMKDIKLDYQISKVIGEGNYAIVYYGKSTEGRFEVAIKRIKKSTIAKSEQHIIALENEIAAIRHLNNPRIVKLVRVYESSRDVCIVQELVVGVELHSRLSTKGSFPEGQVKVFARKLLETLNYMHSKGVVHRDLKPENILLTSENDDMEFKIIDFGLAACCSTSMLHDRCGSPGYVAPEVLDKQPYDSKVDIFSAGVVLYIMLTGRPPFEGDTAREVLIRNMEGHINFQTRELDHISIEFVKFIQTLTQIDPACRPTAAQALKSRLFCSVGHRTVDTEKGISWARLYSLKDLHNRQPAPKPNHFLEGKTSPKQTTNSPIVMHALSCSPSLRQANRKFSIGSSPSDTSPVLPPIRQIQSLTSTKPTNRINVSGLQHVNVQRTLKLILEETGLSRYGLPVQR